MGETTAMKRLGGQQQGLIDLHTLTIVGFILAMIIGCLWYVSIRQTPAAEPIVAKPQAKTEVVKVNDPEPERYHDAAGGFTVSYPGGWQVKNNSSGSGENLISQSTWVSPSQAVKLVISFQPNHIQRNCVPDYYDKPFLTSNRCYSAEYLSLNLLPSTTAEPWYLTHYHYKTTSVNAIELYQSCLINTKPALNKPEMGFEPDHPVNRLTNSDGSVKGYLAACVEAGSQISDLNTPEAQAGEAILRSIRFDQ